MRNGKNAQYALLAKNAQYALLAKYTLITLILLGGTIKAEPKKPTMVLYQVGKDGNYCVSTTRDATGCVSGVDDAGSPVNVMELYKNNDVVFENLSDAYHDMQVTGKNAQNIPAQAPNGSAVRKPMAVEDPNKEKITCSFHGDQLGLGYRVTAPVLNPNGVGDGHKEVGPGGTNGSANLAMNEADVSMSANSLPRQTTQRTGLADVSNEVLRKGRPEEVANLISARPELMDKLQDARPLLAQEVAAGLKGGSRVPGAIGGSALDSNFGAGIGQAPGTVAVLGRGATTAKGGAMGAVGVTSGGNTGGSGGDGEEGEGGDDFSVGGGVNRAAAGEIFTELPASAVTAKGGSTGLPRIVRADTGREIASVEKAELGLGVPDRVKMKNAKAKTDRRDSKLWLILLLLALVLMAMLGVSRATRTKKKGLPS